MGALNEECVDVRQAHLPPGLARGGQVLKQLADMVELLVDCDLWVAAMLGEMRGVVTQDVQVGGARRSTGFHGGTCTPLTS